MDKFDVYAIGIVCASVCSNMSADETAGRLNREHPTGIGSQWQYSGDSFADGAANPHTCEEDSECQHYLFKC